MIRESSCSVCLSQEADPMCSSHPGMTNTLSIVIRKFSHRILCCFRHACNFCCPWSFRRGYQIEAAAAGFTRKAHRGLQECRNIWIDRSVAGHTAGSLGTEQRNGYYVGRFSRLERIVAQLKRRAIIADGMTGFCARNHTSTSMPP